MNVFDQGQVTLYRERSLGRSNWIPEDSLWTMRKDVVQQTGDKFSQLWTKGVHYWNGEQNDEEEKSDDEDEGKDHYDFTTTSTTITTTTTSTSTTVLC